MTDSAPKNQQLNPFCLGTAHTQSAPTRVRFSIRWTGSYPLTRGREQADKSTDSRSAFGCCALVCVALRGSRLTDAISGKPLLASFSWSCLNIKRRSLQGVELKKRKHPGGESEKTFEKGAKRWTKFNDFQSCSARKSGAEPEAQWLELL